MLRYVKYAIATLLLVGVGGSLLMGRSFFSYVKTSARSVQDSVKEQVPIEFELRRARDLIEAILPELQAQVRIIAEEEVEIAALDADIRSSRKQLDGELATLTSMRDQMRTEMVSYRVGGRDWSRDQMTEQLSHRFQRYKQGQLALSSKEQLLAKRNDSLTAALAGLESMRHRKAELEQKVEALAAQARMVKASAIESGIALDSSGLTDADELLGQIETRLHVAQRVIEHESDLFEITPEPTIVDEHSVLSEFDDYFAPATDEQATEASTMVTRAETI